jgi:glycosyltransferase involved in cell wall biosynthesis
MISVFTPSFADEGNTNAQNLTVKEVVSRLDPERFRVIMFAEGPVDNRIAVRPNTKILKWRSHGNTLRMLASFLREIPDIYFFPREGPFDAAVLAIRRLARLRTALITYVVSGGLDHGELRPTMARNMADSDVTVANSRYLSSIVGRRTGSKVPTIYDGVDRRYYYPGASAEHKGLVVLYAGSFRPYKRVPLVIQQAALWPQVEFRLAGTGEEEGKCRILARQLGCKNIRFLGHLPQFELGEQMRAADVFFFPSVVEGHPQVLAQASACGLPCVAMNSYQPEFVAHGRTGLLTNTETELGENLAVLLKNAELRRSMSHAAVAHMQQFDWNHITVEWQKLFEIVTDNKRARSEQNFRHKNLSCSGKERQQPGTPAPELAFAKWPESWPRA